MDEINKVIEFYEDICEKRPGFAFWAENITDASKMLTSHNNHANFYQYLSNPNHFKYQENIPTLRDLNDSELQKIDEELRNLSVKDQRTTIYQNGTERLYVIENGEDEKFDM